MPNTFQIHHGPHLSRQPLVNQPIPLVHQSIILHFVTLTFKELKRLRYAFCKMLFSGSHKCFNFDVVVRFPGLLQRQIRQFFNRTGNWFNFDVVVRCPSLLQRQIHQFFNRSDNWFKFDLVYRSPIRLLIRLREAVLLLWNLIERHLQLKMLVSKISICWLFQFSRLLYFH